MTNTNIEIANVSIFYPDNKIGKEFFINKYDKEDKDIRGLMKKLDRDEVTRMVKDEENIITMGLKAGEKALKKLQLTPEDIDMLIVTTDNPEYFAPSNALILHKKLGTVNSQVTFDINNNCISMLTAIDTASYFMKDKKGINRAMIIGGQAVSYYLREDDVVMYPGSGDGSACLILEKSEDEKRSGVIDSVYLTNSKNEHNMRSPGCGVAKIMSGNEEEIEKKMLFMPHDVSYFSDEWTKLIKQLLKQNNMEVSDISHYLFSQFSHEDIKETLDKLGVSHEKYTFISHKYGYMGCCSPFFALHEAMEKGKIKKGTNIIFCSVGIGYSMSALLYRV